MCFRIFLLRLCWSNLAQQMTGWRGAAAMSSQLKNCLSGEESGRWEQHRAFQVYRTSFNKDKRFWLIVPLVTFCVGYQEHTKIIPGSLTDWRLTGMPNTEGICMLQTKCSSDLPTFSNTNPTSTPSQNSNLLAVRKQSWNIFTELSFLKVFTQILFVCTTKCNTENSFTERLKS